MIGLRFKPWRPLHAQYRRDVVQRFLNDVAATTHQKLRTGMERARGGRLYTTYFRTIGDRVVPVGKRPRPHRASAPGEFPAVDTGRLRNSIRSQVTASSAETGTNMHYARWLRSGTKRMKKRKMSKEALQQAAPIAWSRKGRFAQFRQG